MARLWETGRCDEAKIAVAAGCGFVAAYVGLGVHTVDKTLRSNLALGLSMSVMFLALGLGALIWVRHLMPNVEVTQQRHDLRSDDFVGTTLADDRGEILRGTLGRSTAASGNRAHWSRHAESADTCPMSGTTLPEAAGMITLREHVLQLLAILSSHLRISYRRPSRQDLRPGVGRSAGRDARAGSPRTGGV